MKWIFVTENLEIVFCFFFHRCFDINKFLFDLFLCDDKKRTWKNWVYCERRKKVISNRLDFGVWRIRKKSFIFTSSLANWKKKSDDEEEKCDDRTTVILFRVHVDTYVGPKDVYSNRSNLFMELSWKSRKIMSSKWKTANACRLICTHTNDRIRD